MRASSSFVATLSVASSGRGPTSCESQRSSVLPGFSQVLSPGCAGPQEFVVEIAGGTGTRPNTAALVKLFTGCLLRCPPCKSRSPTGDRGDRSHRDPLGKSARFAIELGKEAAGFGGGGRCRNTGQDRQREHERSDGLHDKSPFVDQ